MRINEDGTDQAIASDADILQLQSVSPDGRWAVAGAIPQNSHGDRNVVIEAIPLQGGAPVIVCDGCSYGFGYARRSAALLSWDHAGKWMYVSLRYLPFGSTKTVAIPVRPGVAPPNLMKGFSTEADIGRIPGARLLNEDNVSPGPSPAYFVSTKRSAKANLFRIYLEQ